jgi:modulator of FtsH protease HflC
MLRTLSGSRRGAALLALLAALLAAWVVGTSLLAVDVTEYAVITRFGRVARVVAEPGPHFKLPSPLERARRLPKRLLTFRPPTAEFLTEDKKNLVVHSLATWRIDDPKRFLETVTTRSNAEVRLGDILLSEIGAVLGTHPFSALISPQGRGGQFQAIVAHVHSGVNQAAFANYGIRVLDVRLRQLNLPQENRTYVFERMKAERGRMAMQYRSEGERDARKITAAADREKARILAEAYKDAERRKAEGDAEAMQIYARAFTRDAQFYKFLRTLQAYEKILDGNTTVFLPADAEVFRLLDGEPQQAPRE